MNREQWLNELASKAAPAIASRLNVSDEEITVKLSCGFPATQGKRKQINAQLVPPTASEDFNSEIFVTPLISSSAAVAAAVLPLLAAVVSGDFKQREIYRNAVRACGLNAETLPTWAADIVAAMPAYPHATIELQAQPKQTTRLIKVSCSGSPAVIHEEYIARLSRKTLNEYGAPVCPICSLTLKGEF